ncbi:MAG: hypothetical protein SFH39_07865 [Candidatus Magnetobacterium sp. LHC-1]
MGHDFPAAIDGKTMCNAIDENGRQTQIMSVIGHTTKNCYTQKKVCSHRPSCDHGRIETRKIWTTTELNEYVNFPHVKQAFAIERHTTIKKSGKESTEVVYGITSQGHEQANAEHILSVSRGHWSIENSCHYIY